MKDTAKIFGSVMVVSFTISAILFVYFYHFFFLPNSQERELARLKSELSKEYFVGDNVGIVEIDRGIDLSLKDTVNIPSNTKALIRRTCRDFDIYLTRCQPYSCIEKKFFARKKREILGMVEGKCIYSELEYEKHIECALSDEAKQKLAGKYKKNRMKITKLHSTITNKKGKNQIYYDNTDFSEFCLVR